MAKEKNTETVELKISPELLAKLSYVAEKEGRTLNNHLLMLARNSVDYYERVHEKIACDKIVCEKLACDKSKPGDAAKQ